MLPLPLTESRPVTLPIVNEPLETVLARRPILPLAEEIAIPLRVPLNEYLALTVTEAVEVPMSGALMAAEASVMSDSLVGFAMSIAASSVPSPESSAATIGSLYEVSPTHLSLTVPLPSVTFKLL